MILVAYHFKCVCVCLGVKTGMRVAAGFQSVTLQPWLVGLTAVVGFLLIIFTVLIAFRLLWKNRSATHKATHTYTP